MLTIAEIAKELDIPSTTAREYVGRFKEYFPTKDVAGKRWPVYLDTAKDVLKDIVEGYKNNQSTEELREDLRAKYPVFIEGHNEDQQRTQNYNNESTTTMGVVGATKSSLDIVTQLQVQQFQWLQKQSEMLEKQTELLERVVTLMEKLEQKDKATGTERANPHKAKKTLSKRPTKPQNRQEKKQQPEQKEPERKGLFGKLFG